MFSERTPLPRFCSPTYYSFQTHTDPTDEFGSVMMTDTDTDAESFSPSRTYWTGARQPSISSAWPQAFQPSPTFQTPASSAWPQAFQTSTSSAWPQAFQPSPTFQTPTSSAWPQALQPSANFQTTTSSVWPQAFQPSPTFQTPASSAWPQAFQTSTSSAWPQALQPSPTFQTPTSSAWPQAFQPSPTLQTSTSSAWPQAFQPSPTLQISTSSAWPQAFQPSPTLQTSTSSAWPQAFQPSPTFQTSTSSAWPQAFQPSPTLQTSTSSAWPQAFTSEAKSWSQHHSTPSTWTAASLASFDFRSTPVSTGSQKGTSPLSGTKQPLSTDTMMSSLSKPYYGEDMSPVEFKHGLPPSPVKTRLVSSSALLHQKICLPLLVRRVPLRSQTPQRQVAYVLRSRQHLRQREKNFMDGKKK